MFGRKEKKKTRGDDSEFAANLGMLGRAPDLPGMDDDDDDLEAELAALMGDGPAPARAKPKKAPVDMSVIDRMAAESMRDVSDDDDIDENDPELLAELQALEPGEAAPQPQPSPQPPGGQLSGLQALLQERKQMYEAAKASAQAKGDGSKVRRYDRGLKTIEGQLKSARAGKPVAEDDIPPPVATGGVPPPQPEPVQPPPAQASAAPVLPTSAPVQPTTAPVQPTTAQPTTAPVQPTTAPVQPQVVDTAPQEPVPMETDSVDKEKLAVITVRRDQYKLAAQAAKKAGDKQATLKYIKTAKQFDAVISAIEAGQPVDLANMPPAPPSPQEVMAQASKQPSSPQSAPPTPAPAPPGTQQAPATSTGVPPPPRTVLEALQQRMDKYKSAADQAKAEGNGSKARRMGRIVKQYADAVKNHKQGKPVDFSELPCPPGYPPIPGVRSVQDNEEADVPGIAVVPPAQPARPAAQPSNAVAGQRSRSKSPQPPGRSRSKSPQPAPRQPVKKSPSGAKSRAQQQLEFLQERQKHFKMAALKAKNEGDIEHAKMLLRQAKGFDPMIEASQNGLPVDLTKIPSLPSEPLGEDEFLDSAEEADPSKIGDSEEMYARLVQTLKKQIETCRSSSQQYTHLGDLQEATKLERMGQASRQDLDTVKNAHNHGDPPPRFHYETRTFRIVKINTELLDSDLEVSIIRGVAFPLPSGISEPKDLYTYVKFELPYPHDKPQEGCTSTFKGEANPEYNHSEKFRIDRKARSWLGTVKRKAVKFEVFYERGFLRSDKSMGEAQLKLEHLENKAEIHEIIDLKDGRKTCGGKLEVKVRQREPLAGKQVQHVQEKWLIIDSVKYRQDGRGAAAPANSPGQSGPNLPSLDVLKFEQKLLERQIQAVKSKGRLPPERSLQVYHEMGQQIQQVQNQLATGGPAVKKAYIRQLEASLTSYHAEAVQWTKQGKKDRAHQALSKKKVVENELMKFKAAAVHTK